MTTNKFNAKKYWESRLTDIFTNRGVGHISFNEQYNQWIYKAKKRTIRQMLKDVNITNENMRVLDIGCGTGYWIDFFRNISAKIDGIDITEVSINRLKEKFTGSDFWTKDISSASFTHEKTYNMINMWDVMYHIVEDELFNNTLANISALLESGGYFLVTDYFGAEKPVVPADHVRYRPLDMYAKVMAKHQMELVKVIPLYRLLNRPMSISQGIHNRIGGLLYYLDGFNTKIPSRNLALALYRKTN